MPFTNTWKVVLPFLPRNLSEMKTLPQASLKNPQDVAALTVAALCVWPSDKNAAVEMLNFLKGPQPLTPYEMSFIQDRFRDADYVPRSYFDGTSPQNNYTPSQPYTVTVCENIYSRQQMNEGYLTLHIASSGADNPRQVKLRTKPSTGEWFLWEQFLLVGIRIPTASDPWA